MNIDGRAIASEILADVARQVEALSRPPLMRAIVMQPSPATESYLNIKSKRAFDARIGFELIRMEDDATTEDIIRKVLLPSADSIIVQLPLPPHIDTEAVLSAIPYEKDADVLTKAGRDAFEEGKEDALLPPVVDAVREILLRTATRVEGAHATVVGNGWLVGQPTAAWLRQQGAEVTVVTRDSGGIENALKDADIIVSGAGSPGLIRPEHLRPGVVLIDAGTSESGGAIVGDADPSCGEIAGVFTPVPGGVGPVAVACLLRSALLCSLRGGKKDV